MLTREQQVAAAAEAIVDILRPFQGIDPPLRDGDRNAKDSTIRSIMFEVADELEMYGMGGCPFCQS